MNERERIIPEKIRKLFTDGLKAGYARKTERNVVYRGGNAFGLDSSHFESPDGNLVYHDEWVNGGGQELVDTFPERERWTRTYTGNTAKTEILNALGITERDITKYLKEKIQELGDKTRLDENCLPKQDGDWQYMYLVIPYEEIPAIKGVERIEYKTKIVFVHVIGITPVR